MLNGLRAVALRMKGTALSNIINLLPSTRGSDIAISVTLTDEAGSVDLTGGSLSVFDVRAELDGLVSGQITDAANGVIEVKIEGTTPIAVGVYSFRV